MKKIISIKSLGIKKVYDVTTNSQNKNFILGNNIVAHNCSYTQPALRNFMEEFSSNCGFILTCNFRNRIIEPLQSRCSIIDFKIDKNVKPKMAAQFFKRLMRILDKEGIDYDKKTIAEIIQIYFPDYRRILNECQRYSANGKIDTGIFINIMDDNFKRLMEIMKAKDFHGMRKWVGENEDIDFNALIRKIYDTIYDNAKERCLPAVVVTLGEYQYKAAFVADQTINTAALLAELLVDVEWK